MIKRTVGSSAVLVAVLAVAAGCSSSSHKATPKASTTTKALTTTSTHGATSTTAATPSTTAAPPTSAAPPTTAVPSGPPPDAETAAKRFFASWLAHDSAGLNANGDTDAVNQATAQYAKTAGSPWEYSNCQGAAGSEYCTWVRAAEDVVVRASSVSPANRAVEFQYHSLEAIDIAEQFVNAWEFGSTDALHALGSAGAVSQIEALNAHRNDGWQAPTRCDGTAGSFYCSFTVATSGLVVRVGDVQVPHQVIEVTYTP